MPKIVEDALVVYTDGSLKWKGRKGGYALVFVHIDSVGNETIVDEHVPLGVKGTTGNRMELQACIDALNLASGQECFAEVQRLVIRTDSQYVASNYIKALGRWRKNRWRDLHGRPIENADLWKKFAREFPKIRKPVEIQKVKGHGKGRLRDEHNVRADTLAKESARGALNDKEHLSSVRRKYSHAMTKKGSVTVFGQQFIIYVIEAKRMRTQQEWQYRYQVVSLESPDRDAIDFIYSDYFLKDGHFYEVVVNSDMKYPRILNVVREVGKDEVESV